MNIPYDAKYSPPMPVLNVRLAAPGGVLRSESQTAIVDTGSDGTLIPSRCLEAVEAIDLGEGVLYSILGEARSVHLYEVDICIENVNLPGVVVIGDDYGREIILGRNLLSKFVLLLDGQHELTDLFEQRPRWRTG